MLLRMTAEYGTQSGSGCLFLLFHVIYSSQCHRLEQGRGYCEAFQPVQRNSTDKGTGAVFTPAVKIKLE